jgi:release factor glutamine methyltransferase
MPPVKAAEVLARGVETLKASPNIDHWQADREEIETDDLLRFVLEVDEIDPGEDVPAPARHRFDRLVARRATGEPVQLIKGFAVFRGLEIIARPGVFVPRDSTEFLAEQAIRRLRGRRDPVAVDLACGGGPVALALADEVPKARVYGTDISSQAIRVARRNAQGLEIEHVTFATGDLFAPLADHLRGQVDVITLHPPYVAKREMRELPGEIRRFEPVHTLTDQSDDGLGLVGRTADESPTWLKRGGWLLVEVSPDRAPAVARILRMHGFTQVRSTHDPGFKVTRVLVARWRG